MFFGEMRDSLDAVYKKFFNLLQSTAHENYIGVVSDVA